MNPQQAIAHQSEVLGKLQANLKDLMESPHLYRILSREDYKVAIQQREREIEALSIVIESAKLFHEVTQVLPLLGGVEMELEYESRWLQPNEVEAIGLKFEWISEEDE